MRTVTFHASNKLFNLNLQSLEAASCYRDSQLQNICDMKSPDIRTEDEMK